MLIVTADEMREIDRRTIEEVGIPGVILMENAGTKVVDQVKVLLKNNHAKVVVLAGHGNNGGDGFVIARHLGNEGYQVETWFLGDVEKLSTDSSINFHALVHCGYPIKFWSKDKHVDLKKRLDEADVIVDAMLGTGVKGALREPFKAVIEHANQSSAKKIAVDIPSGVNSDSGEVIEVAFRADITVTFGLPKMGQVLYPGAEYVGNLKVVDISIPPKIINSMFIRRELLDPDKVAKLLPKREADTHKGTYGHAFIIGGSVDMPGAPTLSTLAAVRSGSGLTTLALPASLKTMVFSRLPEAVFMSLPESEMGNFTEASADIILHQLKRKKYTAVAIGPGIGVWEEGKRWVEKLLRSIKLPVVVDADALTLIANNPDILAEREVATILTPHPGEMARLIGKDIDYIRRNRVKVAEEFSSKYGVYLVLKGANTIIATPKGNSYFNLVGGPELAKGGTGDVLTGMLTSFLAQGYDAEAAIKTGVLLHGLAGLLASNPSSYSTIATDVIGNIGQAIKELTKNN